MHPLTAVRRALWHGAEARPRAPLRLVGGGALLAIAVVVTQLAVLAAVDAGFDPGSSLLFGVATVATGVVVLLSLFPLARFVDRRRVADYGFRLDRDWWIDCGFGLALGVALQAVVFLVGWAAGWYTVTGTLHADGPFLATFLGLVGLFLVVGIYEEALFRGWLLTNLAEGFRFVGDRVAVAAALVVSSALFGLLHAGNPGATPFAVAVVSLAGVMLAGGYLLTGELAIPVGVHVTWNLAQGGFFGHGVSGLGTEATLVATEPTGPALWTGGAFGPEGGLLGLGAVLLGSLAIVGWVRVRRGADGVRLHPAVTTPGLIADTATTRDADADVPNDGPGGEPR